VLFRDHQRVFADVELPLLLLLLLSAN